jgi:hypothetical protein
MLHNSWTAKFEIAGHCQLRSRDAFKEKPGPIIIISLDLNDKTLGIHVARDAVMLYMEETHRHT